MQPSNRKCESATFRLTPQRETLALTDPFCRPFANTLRSTLSLNRQTLHLPLMMLMPFTNRSQRVHSRFAAHCMLPVTLAWLALTLVGTAERSVAQVPKGDGQLVTPPKKFLAGKDITGDAYYLLGQPAQGNKIVLTASNGFFDPGVCRASGDSHRPKVGDEALIKPNFAVLDRWLRTDGTMRWHLWISQPGTLTFNVHLSVGPSQAGSKIIARLGHQSQTLTTAPRDSSTAQPWRLTFSPSQPGQYEFSLQAQTITAKGQGVGSLSHVDVYGPAVQEAQLLRARWRPAAVHGGYACSKVEKSRLWVMTTRSVSDTSSYSPITTPFGYFGTSFDADRRSNGHFNFSMWAARAGGKVPPLKQMPHLLAAGSPAAEFSGFGHEGSGVKLRNWHPMPDRPSTCVQALRVESDGMYDTYYGYFWDHPTERWKLYAVGRKWNQGKPRDNLLPGSFCEVPGPPHLQRTGDLIREVRRRGWVLDQGGRWQAMDTFNCKSKEIANKTWRVTTGGEFTMGTGGMKFYEFKQPPRISKPTPLPNFLSRSATEQLFRLPVAIRDIRVSSTTDSQATINVSLDHAGQDATATIYYGPSDCLTFAKRKLHGTERNSAVSQSTQDNDRAWANTSKPLAVKRGDNQLRLEKLTPNTNYFYRVLVTNREGKVWSFTTGKFHTR